ncbi:uncharacterized protein LOC129585770 isoform X2 [Paramacrobiotus metropolitanus]|nr:uncharacterized protein LOC129585770 isoform X2 [Paramacrobiotus metropolitanus]
MSIDVPVIYVEPPSYLSDHLSTSAIQLTNEHSVIPVVQDLINSADQKILENFVAPHLDPWEAIPRLPDHDVMVGTPINVGSNLHAPQMHMHRDVNGVATGVSDVLLDTIGTPIFQTFFGNRNPYLDDDDWNDEFDEDDGDDKRKQDIDDDDDDDDKDDDKFKKLTKSLLRSKMAPLMVAPSRQRTNRRPAALMHKPVLASKPASMISSPRTLNHPGVRNTGHQRLVIPQLIQTGRVNVNVAGNTLAGYRLASPSMNRASLQLRTLRILYD